MPLPRALDVLTSFLASAVRLWGGVRQAPLGPRPAQRLILYEFEGCPFCRRAREAVGALDLEVEVRSCPKRGERFRAEVVARGGKAQFPYLVDPNTGAEMYESTDIVRYLFENYGSGDPGLWMTGPLFVPTSQLASMVRLMRGVRYQGSPDKAPAEPLTLYGVESSPYCRIVREVLSELGLPYVQRSTPVGSARWAEVKAVGEPGTVPYLIDPNTDTALFESADIVHYLRNQYGR